MEDFKVLSSFIFGSKTVKEIFSCCGQIKFVPLVYVKVIDTQLVIKLLKTLRIIDNNYSDITNFLVQYGSYNGSKFHYIFSITSATYKQDADWRMCTLKI